MFWFCWDARRVNPLTTGLDYNCSFFYFYYHIKCQILNILKIKRDINQQDLKKIVYLHFDSPYIYSGGLMEGGGEGGVMGVMTR